MSGAATGNIVTRAATDDAPTAIARIHPSMRSRHSLRAHARGQPSTIRHWHVHSHAHMQRSRVFFHPDYTVGPGVSPDHAHRCGALAGFTADRE